MSKRWTEWRGDRDCAHENKQTTVNVNGMTLYVTLECRKCYQRIVTRRGPEPALRYDTPACSHDDGKTLKPRTPAYRACLATEPSNEVWFYRTYCPTCGEIYRPGIA